MFQKLRRRITIINAAIMAVLFLFLTAGAYLFFLTNMERRSDMVSRRMLADIQSGWIVDFTQHGPPEMRKEPTNHFKPPMPPGPPESTKSVKPPGPPEPFPGSNSYFVKVSADNTILFRSSNVSLDQENLAELIHAILQTAAPRGTVAFGQTEYSFWKEPMEDQADTAIILFHDMAPENSILRILLTSLIIVGLTCAVLSFGASFFMANRAMIPIQKAWQLQRDFLSDASHELRTPLAVIQTNLDVVRDSPGEPVSSQSHWLDNIQEELTCMSGLVNSLLFLARADSDEQPLDMRLFSFPAFLQRTVEAFIPLAAAKELSLEVSHMPAQKTISSDFYGDEPKLKQLMGILLDNAIRHTPAGGKILLSLTQDEQKTKLAVADSGEGIAPEYLDKIFDRFFQVDASRSMGGAGLGLAIAKWIVESHGGAINVISTPGKGTTFHLQFPRKLQKHAQKDPKGL